MKNSQYIPLTRGQVAIVDPEDFDFLNRWKWFAIKAGKNYYAARWETQGKMVFMHRVILGGDYSQVTDHKDRNSLNNRRANLRVATISQNAANIESQENSTSKYLGVYWDSNRGKWFVTITKNKTRHFIGRFQDEDMAGLAYDSAAKKLHGEFANLNFK